MTQGRLRTPTALRTVKPGEEREPSLPPDMPPCPDFLHPYAKEEWAELSPVLYSLGVLTSLDQKALAGYCQAVARWRLAEEKLAQAAEADAEKQGAMVATTDNGNKVQSVLFTIAAAAMRDMLKFAAEFGMTPSARARIEGKSGKTPDPVAGKYFKRR